MVAQRTPRVTVVTRTRDRLPFLRRAIGSLRSQSFVDWQHVIVNDGGDRSALEALVSEMGHDARVIHHAKPRGMEAASNAGLRVARGMGLIFLDDDDTWVPMCLARLVAARDESPLAEVRGVVCQSSEVHETAAGDRITETTRNVWNHDLRAVGLDALARKNLFTNNAFLVDTSAVRELGAFDTQLPVYGDWDFNLRFFSVHEAVVLCEPLANYHRRDVTADASANSFMREPGLADLGRARLVRKWLAGERSRNPHVGVLLALAPSIEAPVATAARIDKVLNTLHGLRRRGPLALLERTFLR